MATIGPSLFDLMVERRNLSLIEWIDRESLKLREIVAMYSMNSPILSDMFDRREVIAKTFQWRTIRIPRPNRARTDDMRQMIEDLANARRD